MCKNPEPVATPEAVTTSLPTASVVERNQTVDIRGEEVRLPDKSIAEATAETVFLREFALLKHDLKEQKKISFQIIVGVVVAFIFTIGLAALDSIYFHGNSDKNFLLIQDQLQSELDKVRDTSMTSQIKMNESVYDIDKRIQVLEKKK